MYENRNKPLLPRKRFYRRLGYHAALAFSVILLCLAIGMVGYHVFERLAWLDAYTNAAMILSGMGPLDPPKTDAGKLFAGTYALFSGVAFLTTVAVLMAPVAHRVLHTFHLAAAKDS
jgi:hypothetical protein